MSPNDTKEALGVIRGRLATMSREDLEWFASRALDALADVARADFTPDYKYPGGKSTKGVANRNGEIPPDNSRWMTPREIAATLAVRWSR